MNDNSSNQAKRPDDSEPVNKKRGWGWALLGGGCLTTLIAGGSIASSSLLLMGDLMSGGQVAGHGQDELNRSAITVATATIFLVAGITAALIGMVLVVLPARKTD